jgi:transcriptional regulator with XRE-family HTH domain
MDTFGDRLRKFAEKQFKSVSKMASEMGIAQPQMQRYISNENKPKTDFLEKLATLGCDINWLLTGKITEPNGNYNNITAKRSILGQVDAKGDFSFDASEGRINENEDTLLYKTLNEMIQMLKDRNVELEVKVKQMEKTIMDLEEQLKDRPI